MTNKEVERVFAAVADLLQLQGADEFRVRSYSRVVDALRGLGEDIGAVAARGELEKLPGIGKSLAGHLCELLDTGRLTLHEQLLAEIPPGLVTLLEVPELGPKTARRLWQELGLESVDAVEAAAQAGRISPLKGFGAKSEAKLLANIAIWRGGRERVRHVDALALAEPLLAAVRGAAGVERSSLAGSLRRGRDTIKDLDLLVAARDSAPAIAAFVGHESVAEVVLRGDTKATVRLHGGLQADLRVVAPESWGAALGYFTGSQAHNIAMRARARERGLSLNEYGFRPLDSDVVEPVAEEADVYGRLDLQWVPPELREDRGEMAAAAQDTLPTLLKLGDLRGDLHNHTLWSDGQNSVLEMAQAARSRGYQYLAITDHSKALAVVHGLDEGRVREQAKDIAEAQQAVPEVRLLRGIEVDILADGRLDLEADVLAELDVVVASVHSSLNQEPARMTDRLLAAVETGLIGVLGHPTGRKLPRRPGFEFDFDAVIDACARHHTALEINAAPERLDLDDVLARRAHQRGACLCINTDAHVTAWLDNLKWGVVQARRAWLGAADVINAWPTDRLLAWLKG